MKKTIFVTGIVISTLFFAPSVYAENIKFTSTVTNAQGDPVKVTIEVAEGEASVQSLLNKNSANIQKSDSVIMASDMAAEQVADALDENMNGAELSANYSIGFFEIDEDAKNLSKASLAEKRKEKIHAIAFATVQTAISTASFIYLSHLPIEPALMAATLSGALNFYFNLNIERWEKFQRWGRDKISAGVSLLGKEDMNTKRWFSKATKSLTGYIGRIGFTSLYTGIALWQNFASEFLTTSTLSHIAISATVAALMAQPFDTTFGDWMENGHHKLKLSQVHLLARVRTLIASAIVPLLYMGNEYGYAAAMGMFGAGILLVVYDQIDHKQESLSVKISKNSIGKYWGKIFKRPECRTLISESPQSN